MAAPTQILTTIETLSHDPRELTGPRRVALLGDIERTRSWLAARESAVISVIHESRDDVNAGAKDTTQLSQQQANVAFGEAKRRALRATWTAELPEMADALSTGTLGTAHVDELCALADRLTPEQRPALRDAVPSLIAEVASLTVAKTRRHLADFEASLDTDDDGRLERQRRAATLSLTKNRDDTIGVHGTLDPVDGAKVRKAIDAKVAELWRREGKGRADAAVPPNVLSSGTWRARALVELVTKGAAADPASRGRAQTIVLIDHETLLGDMKAAGVARLDDGTPISAAEARRLACGADILPMVLDGSGLPLDVGRAARLATDAQRAALRVLYPTCCVGNCDVAFDHCEIHHLDWWRLGGPTDLDNLKPLCSKHHHLVHDHRWDLAFDTDGEGHLVRRQGALPIQTTERVANRGASPVDPTVDHRGADARTPRPRPAEQSGQPRQPERSRPPGRVAGQTERPTAPTHRRRTPAPPTTETRVRPMRC